MVFWQSYSFKKRNYIEKVVKAQKKKSIIIKIKNPVPSIYNIIHMLESN